MPPETIALCKCGCGRPVTIAKASNKRLGHVKGEPVNFVRGHRAADRSGQRRYHVEESTGCWIWDGALRDGYGLTSLNGRSISAHRWSYLQAHGDLPRVLDHICRNRACINPDHLRPASHALNAQNLTPRTTGFRGVSYDRARGRWRSKVVLDGKAHELGRFTTEEEAARVASDFRAKHMPYSPDAATER